MSINKKIKIFLSVFTAERIKNTFSSLKQKGLKNTVSHIFLALSRAGKNSHLGYDENSAYEKYIKNNEKYDYEKVRSEIDRFPLKPLISILMPVYNVDKNYLIKSINSVIAQYYENWELCIADDNSEYPYIREILTEYMNSDKRINVVFRKENGHISIATNSALEIANGEFIALMDNDDKIPPFALFEVVKRFNEYPETDIFYSDEDKISLSGKRITPHFKPDYSPHLLMSSNFISHLGVYRKKIADEIGGFRKGFEGSQDYDFLLRFLEKTDKIQHIPKILYHWRIIEGSTSLINSEKNYALAAGYNALCETVMRRNYNAEVNYIDDMSYYDVKFLPHKEDFVSIIIPTKDRCDILEKCLKSIYDKTKWSNFEIIIAHNNSAEKNTFQLFREYSDKYDNFTVIKSNMPFNYSKINNEAVKYAKGNLLLFLNNNIEVISSDWLERMAGMAARKEVGCVGAKLLYPNNTVQHGGIVIGAGGIASFVGMNANSNDCGYFARLSVCCNYSAVTGSCMMVKKDIFTEIGGFDEENLAAFSDIDFCLKVLKTGKYNVYVPKALLYHHKPLSKDTPEIKAQFENEIKYMTEKWGDYIANDRFYNPNFSKSAYTFQIMED